MTIIAANEGFDPIDKRRHSSGNIDIGTLVPIDVVLAAVSSVGELDQAQNVRSPV